MIVKAKALSNGVPALCVMIEQAVVEHPTAGVGTHSDARSTLTYAVHNKTGASVKPGLKFTV